MREKVGKRKRKREVRETENERMAVREREK